MNMDNKQVLHTYIALSHSIRLLNHEIKIFRKSNVGVRIIEEMNLDIVLRRIRADYHLLKNLLRFKYNLNIKRTSDYRYIVNGEQVKYTKKEIKNMTNDMIMRYVRSEILE